MGLLQACRHHFAWRLFRFAVILLGTRAVLAEIGQVTASPESSNQSQNVATRSIPSFSDIVMAGGMNGIALV
jgi:hypothetical protein